MSGFDQRAASGLSDVVLMPVVMTWLSILSRSCWLTVSVCVEGLVRQRITDSGSTSCTDRICVMTGSQVIKRLEQELSALQPAHQGLQEEIFALQQSASQQDEALQQAQAGLSAASSERDNLQSQVSLSGRPPCRTCSPCILSFCSVVCALQVSDRCKHIL